ncbi:hypothetical protein SG34_009470 [Thalassomonas viridans]|uniref:IPTL-CTERM protein sorting domain-containing protein n=1 Tax=Thalassomonas viridans TaxID=137584 RepID=A0AAF0C939_9GAMM|nr:hypothetical protein [Thalassomonas viridans]WDE07092.1 hypothetical protein SG34_009470 [Thalassomonas viridans]
MKLRLAQGLALLLSVVFFSAGAGESLTLASPATVNDAGGSNGAFQVIKLENTAVKPGDSVQTPSVLTAAIDPAAGGGAIITWQKSMDVTAAKKPDVSLPPVTGNNAGLLSLGCFLFSLLLILRRKYLYLFR